ncbi:MAG TPA: glutathione S-transferase family protein [Rhizomicrobium sp.]|nr:glutathione S-transferase family protein [Rhizomicrobium sp.]
MKLYTENYPAPNPRKVHIYLAEKGLSDTVGRVHTKMAERMHKAPDFVAKNSLGQVPVLETDDGRFLSESVAICRYIEALHPTPPLFGRSPFEIAQVEMWIRRSEFRLWTPMGQVWINDDPRTAGVNPNQFKEYGAHMRRVVANAMKWIDKELSGGGEYLVGDYFSMADIVLLCGVDFAKFVDMHIPEACTHLKAWHARVSARPSARANGIAV